MNLETHIKPELWAAISSNYQSSHYKEAILDAMHYLRDVLRAKTGLDSDGVNLAGAALGGNAPLLRVNMLQTDTEKNIQKGVHHLVMGMYEAVRNPRSHEQKKDSQEDADAIVFFLDYILGILDQSEESFTIERFLDSVYDRDFVESTRYAELLVSKVPKNRLVDVLIECYRNKARGTGKELDYIVTEIMKSLSTEQVQQFVTVISETLRTTQDDNEIRVTLRILPPKLWIDIQEDARLRIENKLLRLIKDGKIYSGEKIVGALAISGRDFLPYFELRSEAKQIFLHKIYDGTPYEFIYVTKCFTPVLHEVLGEREMKSFANYICRAIRRGNRTVYDMLVEQIDDFAAEWRHAFIENLKDITDPENPARYFLNGQGFLTSNYSPPYPNIDEVPFR